MMRLNPNVLVFLFFENIKISSVPKLTPVQCTTSKINKPHKEKLKIKMTHSPLARELLKRNYDMFMDNNNANIINLISPPSKRSHIDENVS